MLKILTKILAVLCALILTPIICFPNNLTEKQFRPDSKGAFIENRGQWPDKVKFLAKFNGYNAWITQNGIVYDFYQREIINNGDPEKIAFSKKGHVVKVSANEAENISFQPNSAYIFKHNYFIGSDPSKWASNCKVYKSVTIKNVFEGVNARLYSEKGSLRYDYMLQPGSTPDIISLEYEGQDKLGVSPKGDLLIYTSLGEIRHHKIYAYQNIDGLPKTIDCRFEISNGKVGFSLGEYDKSLELIIDPLVYSTYLGPSTSDDFPMGLASDSDGYAYVTGHANSDLFPITAGAYKTTREEIDIFICKINPDRLLPKDQQLVYSTFFGGEALDQGADIVLDASGDIYLTGTTDSENFPTAAEGGTPYDNRGGYHETQLKKYLDIFVARFNNDCSTLKYSSYIGGGLYEAGHSIKLGKDNSVYIAGYTTSEDFPTRSVISYQPVLKGDAEIVVVKMKLDGDGANDMIYSTFIGGSEDEKAYGLAVDQNDNVFISGYTASADFPTTDATKGPPTRTKQKVFVIKMDLNQVRADSYIYSTVFGDEDYSGDDGKVEVWGMEADSNQNLYIVGNTNSDDFPTTTNAFDESFNGETDIFICKYYANETNNPGMKYSTYLGGPADEIAFGLYLDDARNIYVTGMTTSSQEFPTTETAFQTENNGDNDAIVCKLNLGGNGSGDILYSSLVGGKKTDRGIAITLGKNKLVYVTGVSDSSSFPTTRGSYNTVGNNTTDAFFFALDVINPPLKYELTDLEVCYGTPIEIGFKNGISGGSETNDYAYEWLPADGLDDNEIANPTVLNPTGNTVYSVLVTEMKDGKPTGIIADDKVELTVHPLPEVSIEDGYATEACAGDGNDYTFTTTEDPDALIEWKVQNGTPVGNPPYSNANFQVNWNNAGTGKVTLIKTDDVTLCKDSVEVDITVNPMPEVDVTGDLEVCSGCSGVYSTDLAAGETVKWKIEEGTADGADDESNFNVTWNDVGEGNGRIIMTKSNEFGCTDSTILLITITAMPLPTINGDDDVCLGDIIEYTTSDRDGAVNEWSVTQGGEAVDPPPHDGLSFKVRWTSHPGRVSLHQVIEDNNFDEEVTKPIVIRDVPVPEINGKTDPGPNDIETYQATQNASSAFEWTMEPDNLGTFNTTNTNASVDILWKSPGAVSLICKETNENDCDGYDTLQVLIGASGSAITGPVSVCENEQVDYSAPEINGSDLMWTVTGGSIISDPRNSNIIVVWEAPGTGTVQFVRKYTEGGAEETVDTIITINPLPDKPTITRTGNDLENLTSSAPDNNQWYKNGTMLPGETNQEYTPDPDEIAEYSVEVTNEFDCSIMSDPFNFGPSKTAAAFMIRANPNMASVGDKVNLELVIIKPFEFNDDNAATGIKCDLILNAKLLIPDLQSHKGTIVGDNRVMPLQINIPENVNDGDILASIPCTAVLDMFETTDITLTNISPVGGLIIIDSIVQGGFALDNVCSQGGKKRFVTSEGVTQLMDIRPNPAENTCEIEYEMIESGKHEIYIINTFGRKVLTVFDGNGIKGRAIETIDISSLTSGTYYLVLQTPTNQLTVKMNIVK